MLDRIQKSLAAVQNACNSLARPINIMEVCGTHTVAIFRNGIRSILPAGLKLLSGPGCPVCVTSKGYVDIVLQLQENKDNLIATYGDMVRVPGTKGSLETRQSNGNVRVVLSADDALQLAKDNPKKQVVFVAVGFETTSPATAVVVQQAQGQSMSNFFVLSAHKLVVPAMAALVSEKNHRIDAFLCPGHVSAIIGYGAYAQLVEKFNRPCVVAGFEPVQLIEGLAEICTQLAEDRPKLKSVYNAVVTEHGNETAKKITAECFKAADGCWRGLGMIDKSTLQLKDKYERFDAFKRFNVIEDTAEDTSGCRCGEVLCGLIEPPECKLFAKTCNPRTPVGPCMVSSEGACSAFFKYGPRKND